jgi:hypothetical protein
MPGRGTPTWREKAEHHSLTALVSVLADANKDQFFAHMPPLVQHHQRKDIPTA